MAGHQINVSLDDIALRKAAKKALDEALKDMRILSEDQLVAVLEHWCIENGYVDMSPKHLAARLLDISEELEAKSPT